MNSDVPTAVRRLLDLEAEVDDEGFEGDDDEEEGSLDNFIDDEEPSGGLSTPLALPLWNSLQNDDDAFEEIWSRVLSRQPEGLDRSATHDLVSSLPCAQDFPLWRVKCRIGTEEYAILFLLENSNSIHEIRSAFTCGNLRGWVYLECTMNQDLISLLGLTPGIIQTREGIRWQSIPFEDWTDTLQMKSDGTVSEEGRWVQVRKGPYRGDVGVVVAVEAWGVHILLVPRLKPPKPPSSPKCPKTSLKRKRALPPPPPPKQQLFDPKSYKDIYGIDPKRQRDGIYTVAGCNFEHGLIRKGFDYHSVSSATNIPLDLLSLFLGTKHPVLLNTQVPHPQEWDFEIGDEVVVRSAEKQGVIVVVETDHVEVALANLEGVTRVAWQDIYKYFVRGEFVRITGGSSRGKTGWVVGVERDCASIIVKTVEGEILAADPSRALDCLESHVNLLKRISEPTIRALLPPSLEDRPLKTDKSPWLGLEVTITRGPLKGYCGTVKNVLLGQQTISGQRIEVQLSHIDSARPFARELFDYDDIVETSTRLKLVDFARPTNQLLLQNKLYKAPSILQASSSGGATPLPDATSSTPAWDPSSHTPTRTTSLTPAWDPSSHTPTRTSSSTPTWDPSSHTPTASTLPPAANTGQQTHSHPLFDRRLLDISLQVIVNGGTHQNQQLTASLVDIDGRLSIRYEDHHQSRFLEPDWVSFKNPSPTRDNGLLVVIKGEHCGKLVRRIHHKKYPDRVTVLLAVVKKEGATEVLLPERVELHPDFLCLKGEEPKERKVGNALMDSLREEARKRR